MNMVGSFDLRKLCGNGRRLISSDNVSIKRCSTGIVITSGQGHWFTVARFIGIGAIILGIPIASVGMLLRKDTNIFLMLGFVSFLSATGLFFFFWGLKLMLCNGSVIWNEDFGEFEIRHRNWFSTGTLRLSKDQVMLKAYMNKEKRDDLKLGYGNCVLSIVRTNDKSDEMVIAVITKESELIKATGRLERFLPGENLELPEQYKSGGQEGGWGTSEEWERLVGAFKGKTFFGIIGIHAVESKDGIFIGWGWGRWLWATIPLVIGFFCALFLVRTILERDFRELDSLFYLLPMSGMTIYAGFRMLASAQRVLLKPISGNVEVRWGYLPFAKHLIIMKERIEVGFDRCEPDGATQNIGLGDMVLSLRIKGTKGDELLLSSGKRGDNLQFIQQKLAGFVGQAEPDNTLCNLELDAGEDVQFSNAALGGAFSIEERVFVHISPEIGVFPAKLKSASLWLRSVIMGAFILSGTFFIKDAEENSAGAIMLLAGPIGGFMLAVGFFFLVRFFLRRYAVADKKEGTLSFRSYLKGFGYRRTACQLADIVAVQLCTTTGLASSLIPRTMVAYEMNVVSSRRDDDRIRLCCGVDKEKVYSDAQAFARFLGVVLVDDRGEDGRS